MLVLVARAIGPSNVLCARAVYVCILLYKVHLWDVRARGRAAVQVLSGTFKDSVTSVCCSGYEVNILRVSTARFPPPPPPPLSLKFHLRIRKTPCLRVSPHDNTHLLECSLLFL